MKIAILQTDSLPLDKGKINYYLTQCKKSGAKVIFLPEYVLNKFFKDIENIPISFLKKQSIYQISLLKHLSKTYEIIILAPLILIKGDKKYKVIGKFYDGKVRYYYSQVYMPYSHWNEEKFFDKKKNKPLIVNIGKFRFGVIFGFESHFDEFWKFFREKKVDFVSVLSVGTFNSHQRWYEMLKSKAFLNNMYVIRVNRVGKWKDWEFYGKSFVISPEGEDILMLKNNEELGIVEISKDKIKEARKEWKFLKIANNLKF